MATKKDFKLNKTKTMKVIENKHKLEGRFFLRASRITALIFAIFLSVSTVNSQWHQVNSNTTEKLNDIFFVDNQKGYCVGDSGTILKSEDGGQNWSMLNAFSSGEDLYDVYFLDENNGFVSSQKNIFKTTDGGSSFQSLSMLGNALNSTTTMHSVSIELKGEVGVVWAKYIDSNYPSSPVYRSWKTTDFGQNWDSMAVIPPSKYIKIIDENTWFSAWFGYFKTTDGGLSWDTSSVSLPFPPESNNSWAVQGATGKACLLLTYHSELLALNDFDSNDTIFETAWWNANVSFKNEKTVIAYNKSGKSYIRSYDNTGGFLLENTDSIPVGFLGVYFEGVNGWICGDNGVIYRNDNLGILKIQEPAELEKNIKVYPNPVKNVIYLDVSSEVQVQKITLLNLKGEKIKTFSENLKKIDVSALQSGVYFLKFTTENGVSFSKRVVVE